MRKKRVKGFIGLVIDYLGATLMLVIIILVFLQVTTRYIFKNPTSWSEELSSYLLIWLTMVGAIMSFKEKESLKIEAFVQLLSSKYQRLPHLFSDLVIIFVSSVILINGYSFAMLNITQYSHSIGWLSKFWVNLAIPIHSGAILIYTIEDFLKKINILKEDV